MLRLRETLPLLSRRRWVVAALLAVAATGRGGPAPAASLDELAAAVVQVRVQVEPDGRTAETLGKTREGSGVLVDDGGLVLTIGYLMVEARTAEIETGDGRTIPAAVVGYDHETGFGLLRALLPVKAAPLRMGRSADLKEGERVLVASHGGPHAAVLATVASRREFAGSWEYLIEGAIFTSPPHPAWSGAALINRDGQLVGIGSLIVADVGGDATGPGNMFVPVDLLTPILGDLIATGRASRPPRPWLGLSAEEAGSELKVARVTPGSPAARAGIEPGARIVGIDGRRPRGLADFYRQIWSRGSAGTVIPLELADGNDLRRVEILSADRLDHLRLKSSL